jgi:hypothetical protein
MVKVKILELINAHIDVPIMLTIEQRKVNEFSTRSPFFFKTHDVFLVPALNLDPHLTTHR